MKSAFYVIFFYLYYYSLVGINAEELYEMNIISTATREAYPQGVQHASNYPMTNYYDITTLSCLRFQCFSIF